MLTYNILSSRKSFASKIFAVMLFLVVKRLTVEMNPTLRFSALIYFTNFFAVNLFHVQRVRRIIIIPILSLPYRAAFEAI